MERKCAIYNRLSYDNSDELMKMREELIEYCKNYMLIKDYVVFEEIASVENERKEFNQMIERIHNSEFTDLLVYHPDRIYKATYNNEKFDEIISDMAQYNIQFHSIDKKEQNINKEEFELVEMSKENKKLIKEYFELVEMDKEYERKYCKIDFQEDVVREVYKLMRDSIGIWKQVRSIYDIITIIEAGKGYELLRIEDAYIEEYSDLIGKYVNIDYLDLTEEQQDKLYDKEYMEELLNREETAEDLKSCIKILLKSKEVCKKMYEYVSTRKK